MPLTLAGYEVEAFSVAGFQTCIELPQLSLAFDMGVCPRSAVKRSTVLITHTHMDHVAAIGHHAATRALMGMSAPVYVVPPVNVPHIQQLFDAYAKLDGTEHARHVLTHGPGDEFPLGNAELLVRPFVSPHRVPCQGYGLWRKYTKLKPELAGLSPAEVGRLRREGHEVSVPAEAPEVVYTGDTLIDVVDREVAVRKARLLIMELTFLLDDVDVRGARERGHVHLDEVVERADLFENEAILFLHFSGRYTREEILRALDEKLPAKLRERVTALVSGHASVVT